jgi:hypothetical protein
LATLPTSLLEKLLVLLLSHALAALLDQGTHRGGDATRRLREVSHSTGDFDAVP